MNRCVIRGRSYQRAGLSAENAKREVAGRRRRRPPTKKEAGK